MNNNIDNEMSYPFDSDEEAISFFDDGWDFISNIELKHDEKYNDMYVTRKEEESHDGGTILKPYSTLLFKNLPSEEDYF